MKLIVFLLLFSLNCFAQSAFTINYQATGSASSVSTKVLEPKATRNYLFIYNGSFTNQLSIKFDAEHVGNEGVIIAPNTYWEPDRVPSGAVYIKATASTVTYNLVEGVK